MEVLLATEKPKYVTDWSRDGRYVLYTELEPETQANLWYLPMENGGAASELRAGTAAAFLRTEFHGKRRPAFTGWQVARLHLG